MAPLFQGKEPPQIPGRFKYERKRPEALQWPEWTDRLRGQMRQAFAMLEKVPTGDYLIGGRLTKADVTTIVGIGFVRHILPHEWPAGDFPALERRAARLEASEAFLAVPIHGLGMEFSRGYRCFIA